MILSFIKIFRLFNKRNGLTIISLLLLLTIYSRGSEHKTIVRFNQFNILKKENSYTSKFSEFLIKTEFWGESNKFNWKYTFKYNQPKGGIDWGNSKDQTTQTSLDEFSGNFFFKDESYSVSASLFNKSNSLGLSLEWQEKFHNRNNYSVAFLGPSIGYLSAQIKFGKNNPLPAYSNIYYQYSTENGNQFERGLIRWVVPVDYNQIIFKFVPMEQLRLQYSLSNLNLFLEEPEKVQSVNEVYEMYIHGDAYVRKISMNYKIDLISSLYFDYRKFYFNGHLQGYYNSHRFAYVGIVKGSFEDYRFGFNHGNKELYVCDGKFQGELKGAIDAWPFLNGLLRFIGERRHIVSAGKATWLNFSFKDQIFHVKKHQLFGILNFYRIKPEFSYATWRPLYFGFGVDDLKKDSLDIETADLIHLELNSQISLNKIILNFYVSQWLPLKIKKNRQIQESSNDGGGAVPFDNSNPSNTTGGFNFGFFLTSSF